MESLTRLEFQRGWKWLRKACRASVEDMEDYWTQDTVGVKDDRLEKIQVNFADNKWQRHDKKDKSKGRWSSLIINLARRRSIRTPSLASDKWQYSHTKRKLHKGVLIRWWPVWLGRGFRREAMGLKEPSAMQGVSAAGKHLRNMISKTKVTT